MKEIDLQEVQLQRKMANVERLAATYKQRSYNLVEHSFFVMQYFAMICEAEDLSYTAKDLLLASRHDLLEAVTGDLLYPVKNYSKVTEGAWALIEDEILGAYPVLSPYSDVAMKNGFSNRSLHGVMKCADVLDLWVFCTEEITMGNCSHNIRKVLETCKKLLHENYYYESVDKLMKEFYVD